MKDQTLIPILFVAFLGLMMLGNGLTGLVISETCCFPPDCADENLCSSAKQKTENPEGQDLMYSAAGLIIILLSMVFYLRITKNNP